MLRWSVCSVFPSIQTDPCPPTALLQCSEAQKLLNIARELLHTEEAYIKRLNLLDQVTPGLGRRLCVARDGLIASTFQFPVCASGLSN